MTDPQTSTTSLTASDGHVLDAYQAVPAMPIRGAIVVAQEVFGVNRHIQAVARQYAAAGYLAIAPALFDRAQRGTDIAYSDAARGSALMRSLSTDEALLDLAAAIAAAPEHVPVGIVGYCWGGRLSYLAACSLPLKAAVSYYGGGIGAVSQRTPACPMMFHYGDRDSHIPLSEIDVVRERYPKGVYHLYPAGHGFNCSERPSYDQASADLAFSRSVEFFSLHLC
jgi:carboxymethylenebutenolidase